MSDDITKQPPSQFTDSPPQPPRDGDALPRNLRTAPHVPLPVGEMIACGLIVAFMGGVLGTTLITCGAGWFGMIAGAVLGAWLGRCAARGKLGTGTRVHDRALPNEPTNVSNTTRPALPHPDDPRIIARRTNRTIRATLPQRHVSQLVGKDGCISAMASSPDGLYVATATTDGMIGIWDLQTGQKIGRLPGFPTRTNALAYSADGLLLVGAGIHTRPNRGGMANAGALVWDAESGQLLRQMDFTDLAWSLTFLPGDRDIIIGGNNHLRGWELEGPSPTLYHSLWHGSTIHCELRSVAVEPNGRFVFAGCHLSQDICHVDLANGTEVTRLQGHGGIFRLFRRGAVVSLALSPNGTKLLSGSWDQTARVWRLPERQAGVCFRGHQGWWGWRGVVGVAWLNDHRAVSVSEDGRLCVWETATGKELERREVGSGVNCLARTGSGLILTGGADGIVRIWNCGEWVR